MALRPSHAWWALAEEIGNVWEAALASPWDGPNDPGGWVALQRSFRDGRTEEWWALEAEGGPYGTQGPERLVMVSTDPQSLPEHSTSYLLTNLPAPDSGRAQKCQHPVADLAEVLRLYTLRVWIEQSYKQLKNSLGWAHYQVRKDLSIRRHWQLVCCAFTFCWWANADLLRKEAPLGVVLQERTETPVGSEPSGRGKKEWRSATLTTTVLAKGSAGGEGMVGAVPNAHALLEGVLREGPA